MYRETDSAEEQERVMNALGFIRDNEILHDVLDFAITDVRIQDTVLIFKSVCSSTRGMNIAWDFFKEHWTLFRSRYTVIQLRTNSKQNDSLF